MNKLQPESPTPSLNPEELETVPLIDPKTTSYSSVTSGTETPQREVQIHMDNNMGRFMGRNVGLYANRDIRKASQRNGHMRVSAACCILLIVGVVTYVILRQLKLLPKE